MSTTALKLGDLSKAMSLHPSSPTADGLYVEAAAKMAEFQSVLEEVTVDCV